MRQYRHGDVMLQEVEALPGDLEKLPHRILAHGEVTGHCHRIQETELSALYMSPDGLFLEVRDGSVSLTHEEHATISLAPGRYRVWRQREYSPKEIRIVRD